MSAAETLSRVVIKTNNVPRPLIEAYELDAEAREQFDYLDWEAIGLGLDSAYFVRYRGELIDLSEFERVSDVGDFRKAGWTHKLNDTYFSGLLLRDASDDFEQRVVVGRFWS